MLSKTSTFVEIEHAEMDVMACVKVSDPEAVHAEVKRILSLRFPEQDLSLIDKAFSYFNKCYAGKHDDYHACEMPYHDIQHVMDVSLATLRLLDGYEQKHHEAALGAERVILGFVVALFHDAGYLRYSSDYQSRHGAEHTPVHVSRSGLFITEFLNTHELGHLVEIAKTLVQFTGIEQKIEDLQFDDPLYFQVGYMIGTADLIAQMADRRYAEKCRAHLYTEFSIAGMTQKKAADGSIEIIYASADDLLRKTPGFIDDVIENRLKKSFHKVYEYAAVFFGGRNLYMESIARNRADIIQMTAQSQH